jgi:hypothetical protein
MKINYIDKEGCVIKKDIHADRVIAAAFKELLLSHDHLYRCVFPGPPANPSWDIAAKNARKIYKSLRHNLPLHLLRLTIECEFLK